MQTNQTPDPRKKENQDEQANTADQGNQLLEDPANAEKVTTNKEVITNDQDGKDDDAPNYDKDDA
jgi:hypothetical protein